MKAHKITSAIVLALASSSVLANDWEVSGSVDLVSKYIFRGAELSSDPALQAGVEGSLDGLTVGAWASNYEGEDTEVELDLYAGYAMEMSEGVELDFGIINYRYPTQDGADDTTEIHVGVATGLFYFAARHDFDLGQYLEANIEHALTDELSIGGHVGYAIPDADNADEFLDYGVTLSYAVNDSVGVYLSATDVEDGDSNVFAGVSFGF